MEKEEARTDTQTRIRKAGYDDIDSMKRVLARAYDRDPFANWVVLQGNGIGGQLIQHGLQMCNERGLPAYLETATEKNVRYYEKHNFNVSEEAILGGGLKVWGMIYEPQ